MDGKRKAGSTNNIRNVFRPLCHCLRLAFVAIQFVRSSEGVSASQKLPLRTQPPSSPSPLPRPRPSASGEAEVIRGRETVKRVRCLAEPHLSTWRARQVSNTGFLQGFTGFSSQIGTKLRDWAVGQAEAGFYSQAALSSNDVKTRYNVHQCKRWIPNKEDKQQ